MLPRIALSITVFYYLIHVYHKRVLLVFYTPYKKDVFPMYLEYLYGFLLLLYYPLFNKYVKKNPIHTPLEPPTKETLPFFQSDRSKISGLSYFSPGYNRLFWVVFLIIHIKPYIILIFIGHLKVNFEVNYYFQGLLIKSQRL